MLWIKVYDTMPDHPKVIACAAALGIDKDAMIGKLIRLWTWAANCREDGYISVGDVERVCETMRWKGDPETLMDALCTPPERYSNALVTRYGNGYVLHDWDEYVAALVDKRDEEREKTRIRVRNYRNRKAEQGESAKQADCNADVTRYGNADCNACNGVRLDKTRLDKTIQKDGGGGVTSYEDQDAPPPPPPPPDPMDPACLDPIDAACQRILIEFLPCGIAPPNVRTQDEIITYLTLPDYGPTLEAREGLIMRAMKAAGEGNPKYRTWGGIKSLIGYWQKNGEKKPEQAEKKRDPPGLRDPKPGQLDARVRYD